MARQRLCPTAMTALRSAQLHRTARAWRLIASLAAALPLLQTAGCVDIAQRSVINGFFNAFNAWLAAALGASTV